MIRTALALCLLALAPAQAIPVPPLPLPLPWEPSPTFPVPDGEPEPQARIERLPYSSDQLPYKSYGTLGELGHALTVKRLLDALRAADDPAAVLAAMTPRLERSGDFSSELIRLEHAIDDDQLLPTIRQMEVEIGAAQLPPGIPGGGYNPWGRRPDWDALDALAERLFPRPLLPSRIPAGTGWRFIF